MEGSCVYMGPLGTCQGFSLSPLHSPSCFTQKETEARGASVGGDWVSRRPSGKLSVGLPRKGFGTDVTGQSCTPLLGYLQLPPGPAQARCAPAPLAGDTPPPRWAHTLMLNFSVHLSKTCSPNETYGLHINSY
jgi:hypothetical protein